jgi:hypothetical protein
VTKMNMGPRLLSVCSLAASEAEAEEAGYSPPAPNPTMPLDTVNIQNIPLIVTPWEAGTMLTSGQSELFVSMPTSSQYSTKYDHQGCNNNSGLSSQVVTSHAKS